MPSEDDVVERVLAAPAACMFLLAIREHEIPLDEALAPRRAFDLACGAVDKLSPWRADHAQVKTALKEQAPGLRDLAIQMIERPMFHAWFDPIDRDAQMWVATDRMLVEEPRITGSSWERYAQKPTGAFWTSTLREGTSSLSRVIELGVYDWATSKPPLHRATVTLKENLRVFEIHAPEDWHELALRYPAIDEDSTSPALGSVVPDWRAVSSDWDGVHLSFGGLLMSHQVRHGSATDWSFLWAWEGEWTLWLRSTFEIKDPWPDVTEFDQRRRWQSVSHLG